MSLDEQIHAVLAVAKHFLLQTDEGLKTASLSVDAGREADDAVPVVYET